MEKERMPARNAENRPPAPMDVWIQIFRMMDQGRACLVRRMPGLVPGRTTGFSQLRVLDCILKSPECGLKVKELAEMLGITSGGVSQIVDNLVRDGLVERRVMAQDRRSVRIRLSAAGDERRHKIDAFFCSVIGAALQEFPPEKQEAFFDVLKKLADAFAGA